MCQCTIALFDLGVKGGISIIRFWICRDVRVSLHMCTGHDTIQYI